LPDRTLRRLGIERPRIAIAGLNPHAGEERPVRAGRDRDHRPAVAQAQASGYDATGPYPPDTIFYRASRGEFDVVVAMYHDQGHIPIKLAGFESGVNVSGRPAVRAHVGGPRHRVRHRGPGRRLGKQPRCRNHAGGRMVG
jgi:4-hydroxythreonine-4-phosphate dehydrogenase